MLRKPVTSTSLKEVGYDQASRILEVQFHNHRVYQYLDVPIGVHAHLLSSDSLGAYLNRHIKGYFQYRLIE